MEEVRGKDLCVSMTYGEAPLKKRAVVFNREKHGHLRISRIKYR